MTPSRMMNSIPLIIAIVTMSIGCVTTSEHQQAIDEWASRLQAAQAETARSDAEIAELKQRLTALEAQVAERNARLNDAASSYAALQKKLDDVTALDQQLRKELEKLGKNVDGLLAEKGTLRSALDDTKKRLEELRKAQEAAQKRAQLFRELALKFKKMVDAGNLKIVLRDGRMVLQLRNDVLFDSGSSLITTAGKDALGDVAGVLVTIDDRRLQVAGHTDSVPIVTARFPSNWELSTSRAVNVVKFLMEEGVKPEVLSAAGYGEHDPVASNDTAEGKAKNRRIEIVLQPNISELVSVPESG